MNTPVMMLTLLQAAQSPLLAQAAPAGGRTLTVMMIYLLGFGMIFWFLILRPQRRMQQRHQSLIAALKKGDEVMTEGGILGSVVHLTEDRVTIKTAENTRIVIARPKIARVFTSSPEDKG